MTQFVRSAGWLRHLFTPSQTRQSNPVEVSDDVSLTQPYDGGGYPLFDPGQWEVGVTSATVAAAITTLLTIPPDQICRILAVSADLTAGVAPDCSVELVTQASQNAGISETLLAVSAGHHGIQVYCPVAGPGHIIGGRHTGGDAATIIDWRLLYILAPIGTVFYV